MRPTRFLILLLLATPTYAQLSKDQEAYCAYTEQIAKAQQIYLRSPQIESGMTQQPISSGVPQVYTGLINSLTDDRKSILVGRAASKDCELYRSTVEAQQRIMYAIPSLEAGTLKARLQFLGSTLIKIDEMLSEGSKRMAVHETTLPNLYALQSARARTESDLAATRLTLATAYIPEMSDDRLSDLLAVKQALEVEKFQADSRVSKVDDWNVQLKAGIHHDLSGFFTGTPGGYGGFTIQYNFGARSRDRALSVAATHYGEYKAAQQNDVAQQAHILVQQIKESIEVQQKTLETFTAEERQIDANLTTLVGVDTSTARAFNDQLTIDRLGLEVEIRTVQFRIAQLQDYLTKNF